MGQQEGKTVTTLDIVYSGDFSATDKGIEFAKAMIDQGADVFFGDASAVDSGARQAIDEANAASGSVSIYDIAQPSDLLGQNECIIGSQVTDNASLVGLCMEAVRMAPSAARSSTAPCRTVPCPPVPSATWCPPMFRRSIRATWTRWWTAALCSKIYTRKPLRSIQMPGWSRFPPCPGNFCQR